MKDKLLAFWEWLGTVGWAWFLPLARWNRVVHAMLAGLGGVIVWTALVLATVLLWPVASVGTVVVGWFKGFEESRT